MWVEGMPNAMVASRTQETILEEMGAEPSRAESAARESAHRTSRRSSPTGVETRGAARGQRARRRARACSAGRSCATASAAGSSRSRPTRPTTRRVTPFGAHTAQRLDVRRAGHAVRLPLVRHPLVRQRRLRAGGHRGRRAAPRARADGGARRDARAARRRRSSGTSARGLASSPRRSGSRRPTTGVLLAGPPFALEPPDARARRRAATPRVGITKAVDLPWRYLIRETQWASRGPRPASP